MADKIYQPKFEHQDWIDNEDIVSAQDNSGKPGFNKIFRDLQGELGAIADALELLRSTVVPVSPTTVLTFAPAFSPVGARPPWDLVNGIASKNFGGPTTDAEGWMQVQLPDGYRMQSVTVRGERTGNVGSFVVQLLSQGLAGTGLTTILALTLDDKPSPINFTDNVPSAVAAINGATNKYLIVAKVTAASNNSKAQIDAIQILCSRI